MKNAAVALFVLSTIVSLAGAYIRGRFIYAEEQPTVLSLRIAWDLQKRLYVVFFTMAVLGLVFALTNLFAFAFLGFGDDGAVWAVATAGTWSATVLILFATTYRAA